mmetsp:Transcript_7639/g.22399  ORF Transcript_7639/g.22399 Transcript_7639/m.22399 type:complete len:215 (-) Transcript_7639:407-1051(-)
MPWLEQKKNQSIAAWFRGLSSSSGFMFQESASASVRPAASTWARHWDCTSASSFPSSSSSSGPPLALFQASRLAMRGAPWKPWITARALSLRPSAPCSPSPLRLVTDMSPSSASLCTTRSSSSTSSTKASLTFGSSPASLSFPGSSVLIVVSMSVTDSKIVLPTDLICSSRFSSGRNTTVETVLERNSEKHVVSSRTAKRVAMFMAEFIWLSCL